MLVNWEVVKSRVVYDTANVLHQLATRVFVAGGLFLCWLALVEVELAAKVLGRCIQQPVGVDQTEVSHVAAGGVQQLVEDHVRWLGLEKDGGRVDGHGLVGV